jgi:hypothetical protein
LRRETKAEREAWTRYVDGGEAKVNKYRAERTGHYASKHEAEAAVNYQALARAGKIKDYQEQKRITLVPGDGKIRPIVYVADFYYVDLDGTPHVVDAKSSYTAKMPVYRLKKRLLKLLHGVDIEEV